jgi:hypothetical protein
MKEIQNLPVFRARRNQTAISFVIVLFLIVCHAGCIFRVKHRKKDPIPPAILNAKTAGFDELLNRIASYNKINDLSSTGLKLTLKRRISDEESEDWRSASGHIYLKRPDSVRITLRSPFATEFDMTSVGDNLRAWVPSKNRFYLGKNSAKELVSEGFTIPIRGPHIFNAILPLIFEPNSPEFRISMEEGIDSEHKYYIISFYRDTSSRRMHAFRRIWIERSQMVMCRQQFFLEDGRLESDIEYQEMEMINDLTLPHKLILDRPFEGYLLIMEFNKEKWRINTGLEEKAFDLPIPKGAEIMNLTETKENGTP